MLKPVDKQVILRAKRLGVMPQLYKLIAGFSDFFIRHSGRKHCDEHPGAVDSYAIRHVFWNLNYIEDDCRFIFQLNQLLDEYYDIITIRPAIPCVKMKYL